MSANLLGQVPPSRPGTQFLPDLGVGGSFMSEGPSDMELEMATQKILKASDLNTVTKREVRRQLEQTYGCDLTSRKAVINAAIDRHLSA